MPPSENCSSWRPPTDKTLLALGTPLPSTHHAHTLFAPQDTVNRAARLEATCPHNSVHVSANTWDALGRPAHDPCWSSNQVHAKGIGELRTMIWRDTVSAITLCMYA